MIGIFFFEAEFLNFGRNKLSSDRGARALTNPSQATPSPPLMNGGNSQPSMSVRILAMIV